MQRYIDHFGIIVPNLEEGMARWTRATGFEFGPIMRYRTTHYVDHSSPEPHYHDARITHSIGPEPRIELMEATGEGTHSLAEAGMHHIAFLGIPDIEEVRDERTAGGFPIDGESYLPDGRLHLFFTGKPALDGIRIEYCSDRPGNNYPETEEDRKADAAARAGS
jgi:catechol 2,3-dioxygenase-like lactoylglutathione lyase family enzyme